MLEIHSGGQKASEFVSIKFESDVSLTPEQVLVEQSKAHAIVDEAVVINALASASISGDLAKELLEQSKERHSGILDSLNKRYGVTDDVAAFFEDEEGTT